MDDHMTEREKLKANISRMGIKNMGFSAGPDATPESLAREINNALMAIGSGDFEIVDLDD